MVAASRKARADGHERGDGRRFSDAGTTKPSLPRAAWLALAVVTLATLLTLDDRHPGLSADGRQISFTAVAIVEAGEVGQARARDFTWPRRDVGDAVSRYGMGMSFAQVPAAWMASRVEATRGPGSSQPLFLVAPLLFVLLAAWAAGRSGVPARIVRGVRPVRAAPGGDAGSRLRVVVRSSG